MGPFDHIQKQGSEAIKPQPANIRREIISTVIKPQKKLIPTPIIRARSKNRRSTHQTINTFNISNSSNLCGQPSKKRPFINSSPLVFDSDDESRKETLDVSRKLLKRKSDHYLDLNRRVRNHEGRISNQTETLQFVHAAEISTVRNSAKYRRAFLSTPEASVVYLQYPSTCAKEKFELVVPIQKDDFKPLEDIKEILEVITNYYLPAVESARLNDESHGLLRQLKRAADRSLGEEYVSLVEKWNDIVTNLVKNGTVSQALDEWNCLDLKLVERILTQTYSRTVSLHVRDLGHYQNGTDNVYGELLPKFVSDILRKDTRIKSNHIFVDLGSGVGNVVLQAALEIGCESWGCEIMDKACNLAELQEKEFKARCQLWGLAAGEVHLERGDFLKNTTISSILRKADVLLVNNQAFTPELNDDLISLFLDLKEGCQIVSLKSFVPSGHKITSRNLDNPCNVLDVIEKRYYSSCVSWTDAPGTYYISTMDRSKLLSYAASL